MSKELEAIVEWLEAESDEMRREFKRGGGTYYDGISDAYMNAAAKLRNYLSTQAGEGWRDIATAFVRDVASQKPEKPDYWTSCGQCERNISEAEDLLAALPSPPSDTKGESGG